MFWSSPTRIFRKLSLSSVLPSRWTCVPDVAGVLSELVGSTDICDLSLSSGEHVDQHAVRQRDRRLFSGFGGSVVGVGGARTAPLLLEGAVPEGRLALFAAGGADVELSEVDAMRGELATELIAAVAQHRRRLGGVGNHSGHDAVRRGAQVDVHAAQLLGVELHPRLGDAIRLRD